MQVFVARIVDAFLKSTLEIVIALLLLCYDGAQLMFPGLHDAAR